jgi:hypothetical protein
VGEHLSSWVVVGAAAAAAVVALGGWSAAGAVARRRAPRPLTGDEAYRALRAHPSADRELVLLLHNYLRRRATTHGDFDAVMLLDEAYRAAPPSPSTIEDEPVVNLAATDEAVSDADAAPPPAQVDEPPVPLRRDADMAAGVAAVVSPPSGVPAVQAAPALLMAAGGRPALRVLEGGREVQSIPLRDDAVYTIGTGRHCDVQLPLAAGQGSATIGAEHARITVRRGRVLFHHVADEGYSLVNGEQMVWAVLDPGDEIGVGPYVCTFAGAGDDAPPDGEGAGP